MDRSSSILAILAVTALCAIPIAEQQTRAADSASSTSTRALPGAMSGEPIVTAQCRCCGGRCR